jgi:hypothetical protein
VRAIELEMTRESGEQLGAQHFTFANAERWPVPGPIIESGLHENITTLSRFSRIASMTNLPHVVSRTQEQPTLPEWTDRTLEYKRFCSVHSKHNLPPESQIGRQFHNLGDSKSQVILLFPDRKEDRARHARIFSRHTQMTLTHLAR